MNIPELSKDEATIAAKATADLAEAKAAEAAVKSWFEANWQYAVAIAVGFLFLGTAIGIKIGEHVHA